MPLPEIKSIGLKKYLDDTAYKHRKKTYDDFIEMIEFKASNRYMARAFHVNRNTMNKWVEIHQAEQKQAKTVQQ